MLDNALTCFLNRQIQLALRYTFSANRITKNCQKRLTGSILDGSDISLLERKRPCLQIKHLLGIVGIFLRVRCFTAPAGAK
jgi:hypothetical protein